MLRVPRETFETTYVIAGFQVMNFLANVSKKAMLQMGLQIATCGLHFRHVLS